MRTRRGQAAYPGGYSIDANEAWVTVEPRIFRQNGSVYGAIYGHGHSTLLHAADVLLYDLPLLGDAGWAVARRGRQVFMADFEDNVWGNDAAIYAMGEAYNWLTGYLGAKSGGVFLMGGSMGFLTVCNWARQNQSLVKAIAGLIPVASLDGIHDRNYSGYAAEIEAAYGGLAAYEAALPTHDPTAYGAADLANIPISLWYSENDPATLAAEVTTFGGLVGAEMHPLGELGHSYVGMDLDDIPDFFNEHD